MSHSDDRVTIFVPASLKARLPVLGHTVSQICQAALSRAAESAERERDAMADAEPLPGWEREFLDKQAAEAMAAGAMTGYWAEHAEDVVAVSLIDLAGVITRLRQVDREGPGGAPVLFSRLFTCDLPRLERYLPPAAAAEIQARVAGRPAGPAGTH